MLGIINDGNTRVCHLLCLVLYPHIIALGEGHMCINFIKSRILNGKYIGVLLIIVITLLELISLIGVINTNYLMSFCSIVLVILMYKHIGNSFRKMAGFFLIIGSVLGIWGHQPISTWLSGINSLANITAILVIMQLFSIPIKMGNYSDALSYAVFKIFRSERTLFICVYFIIHLLSSFLLFGTIPVALALIEAPIKRRVMQYKRFLSTILTRSYGTVVLWAPGAVNVLLVMEATETKWIDLFPIGAILALTGGVLSYCLQFKELAPVRHLDKVTLDEASLWCNTEKASAYHKIMNIIIVVLALTGAIVGIEYIGIANANLQIMCAGLAVSSIWIGASLYRGEKTSLRNAINEYIVLGLGKTVDLAFLYVALGFFSTMLEASNILDYFSPYVIQMSISCGILIVPIIIGLTLMLSIAGLHPFVLIIILGNILMNAQQAISPVAIAMSLLFGASMSYIISPFAGIVLTTSKFLGIPIRDVGIYWNGRFCILYFLIGSIIILAW